MQSLMAMRLFIILVYADTKAAWLLAAWALPLSLYNMQDLKSTGVNSCLTFVGKVFPALARPYVTFRRS